MAKPTIIGTGLSGMIGSRFTEMFASDFEFINLDLTNQIDITNPAQVDQALNQHPSTSVIHLAALTDVSKAYCETGNKNGMVYKVNVLGTQNIANACYKYHHYLIHISTDFVFDGKKQKPYTEVDQPQPIEWYGQTKLWAEQKVIDSGCQHVICRLAFPFRAKFPAKEDLVRKILAKLKTNTLHPMFTDQIITPTFIDDICQVLKLFVEKQPSGIYHCVGSTFLSPFELAKRIAAISDIKVDIKSISFQDFLKTDPRPRQQFLKISNTKLVTDFGIVMQDIDSALQQLKFQL